MDTSELTERLREHFKKTGTSEFLLPGGYKVFLGSNGSVYLNRNGGSVEISLTDKAMQVLIAGALPGPAEPADKLDLSPIPYGTHPLLHSTIEYKELDPNAPPAVDPGIQAGMDDLTIGASDTTPELKKAIDELSV